jgi:hypothetical protein
MQRARKMKISIQTMVAAFILTLLITTISYTKMYKWEDEQGKLHITDTPPPENAKILEQLETKKDFRKASQPVSSQNNTPQRYKSRPSHVPSAKPTGNPISKIHRNKAYADIKSKLERKYSPSYSLIKTLLNSNMKAYDDLIRIPNNSVNNAILQKLVSYSTPPYGIRKIRMQP